MPPKKRARTASLTAGLSEGARAEGIRLDGAAHYLEPPPEPPPNMKNVVVTHTRAFALSTVLDKQLQSTVRPRIENLVAQVSGAVREGSRFADFWTRKLLDLHNGNIPADHLWSRMFCQAFAAMKDGARPIKKVELYETAVAEWNAALPSLPKRDLLGTQALTFESNAYYNTLACNYVKVALPHHVLWALQFIYPEHRATFKLFLIQRAKPGTNALKTETFEALPEDAKRDMAAALALADAKFADTTLSGATNLRWKLLCDMTRVASGPTRQRPNRKGELIDIKPKWFTLLPHANKSARFITVDNAVARVLCGLPEKAPSAESTARVNFVWKLFGASKHVRKVMRRRSGKLYFPATVKTNGVEVHFPFEEVIVAPNTASEARLQKRRAKDKDFRTSDTVELQQQIYTAPEDLNQHRKGLFALSAADGLVLPAGFKTVGVDPGEKYLVYTSDNKYLTRQQYYGGTKPVQRVLSDEERLQIREVIRQRNLEKPVGNKTANKKKKKNEDWVHFPQVYRASSTAAKEHFLPACIQEAQDALKAAPLRCPVTSFAANLLVWATHSKALQKFYGSRTWRSRRLVLSGRKRAALDGVVNLVAPDPRTIVVFGANYTGRCCRFGDVAGPVCVKALRRKLAQHRVVVAVDEYNTTKMHLACGKQLETDPEDASGHEKICRHCGTSNDSPLKVKRDKNAADNIRLVFTHYVDPASKAAGDDPWLRRPAHLLRPESVPVPIIVAEP